MLTLEDFLELKSERRYGSKVYIVRFKLTLMQLVPEFLPEEVKDSVLNYIKMDLKNAYVDRILRLSFRSLESRKLRNLKLLDCDVVIAPQIRPNLIILNPETFSKLVNEYADLVVSESDEKEQSRENASS